MPKKARENKREFIIVTLYFFNFRACIGLRLMKYRLMFFYSQINIVLISRVIGFKVLGLQNCMFVPLTREKAKSVTKMHNASNLLNNFVALAFFCFQYLHVITAVARTLIGGGVYSYIHVLSD